MPFELPAFKWVILRTACVILQMVHRWAATTSLGSLFRGLFTALETGWARIQVQRRPRSKSPIPT